MKNKGRRASSLIESYARIYEGAERTACGDRCMVAPSPDLQEKLNKELENIRADASPSVARLLKARENNRVGFNDGLLFPGDPLKVSQGVALRLGQHFLGESYGVGSGVVLWLTAPPLLGGTLTLAAALSP